jgi:hypothetical protein
MIGKKILYVLAVIFLLLSLSGCTIIGFMVGNHVDTSNAILESPTTENLQKIQQDTRLEVKFHSGRILQGNFQGIERVTSDEYLRRYSDFYTNPGLHPWFPVLKDTLTLRKKSGFQFITDKTLYRFVGFDFNCILLQPLSEEITMGMKMDNLAIIINQRGKKMSGQYIRTVVLSGVVPLRSELLLKVNNEMRRIKGEDIAEIILPKSATGRIIGTMAGFGIDFLVGRAIGRHIRMEINLGHL